MGDDINGYRSCIYKESYSLFFYYSIFYLLVLVWSFLLFSALVFLQCSFHPRNKTGKTSSFTGIRILVLCIGTMQYTTNYVFSHMNVGYALALFQLSTIISIVLGYRIFKEQNIKKKLLGAVIMVVGSVVIILLD